MSTRGFIGMTSADRTLITYNHYDSYPTYLGVQMAKFVRSADLDAAAQKFMALTPVDESGKPSPEQLADLKKRGFWQDVSAGDDWYAALRGAQGSLLEYLEAGYIPAMSAEVIRKSDIWIEWGYVVDLDARELKIYEAGEEGLPMRKRYISFNMLTIMDEDAVSLLMTEIEGAE